MLQFFNIPKFEEKPNDAFVKHLRMEDGKREEDIPRKGRNPATGKDMMIAPKKRVTFRCSKKLREKISPN
jgi:hypothetical protein